MRKKIGTQLACFSVGHHKNHARETKHNVAHFAARVWERKPSMFCIIKLARGIKKHAGK